MNIRRSIVGAVLAGASLVGVASVTSVAHAADPLEGTASSATGEVTAAASSSFPVQSWSDREWVVSKVFATDGSGHDTRVGKFLPGDSYPAVGATLSFGKSMTVDVDGSSWGTHGISVLFYNKSNPKETLQLWFVRGFFSSHVDKKSPDNLLVHASGRDGVMIWDLDWV